MALPQLAVIALLWHWSLPVYAAVVGLLLLAQLALMARLLEPPGRVPPGTTPPAPAFT